MARTKITPVQMYNPVKFSVYRNAAANSGNLAFALLVFDTKEFDTSTNFSTVSGQFTAPVAGFYQFNWGVASNVNVSIWITSLFKNGAEVRRGSDIRPSTQPAGSTGGCLIQLAANDVIDVRVFANATSAILPGSGTAYFSGYLVTTT